MHIHPCGHSHGINSVCFIKFHRFEGLIIYLSTDKETKDDNLLGHLWTNAFGMGLEYSMIAMCLSITLKKLFFVFFISIKVSLTPSLSTSCLFCFPSRFLMHFACFSIEAGVDNATTMWVRVQRMTNSVSRSFLKLFSWY